MGYQVAGLYRYPVKSMGAVALPKAAIDRFGVEKDRRWMLVDHKNQFLTQRKISKMAQLRVIEYQNLEGGWEISIEIAEAVAQAMEAPSKHSLRVSVDEHFANGIISVQVWGDCCDGKLADDSINQWLSQILGVECRLVFMDDDYRRAVDKEYARNNETVSFADGFPLLLTTESSLEAFNQHLEKPIDMLRFRPNIVVAGNKAFEEDGWGRLRVGTMDFKVVKPCSRCAIPTINPKTAKKEPEVFKALKQHRSKGREVYFGQNLLAVGTGVISVGDSVEILE